MNPLHFDIADILFIIFVILIIFLAIREILCWYWKINSQLSTQRNILKTLEDILHEMRNQRNQEFSIPTTSNSLETVK